MTGRWKIRWTNKLVDRLRGYADEGMTSAEAASALSAHLGHPVSFSQVTSAQHRFGVKFCGLPRVMWSDDRVDMVRRCALENLPIWLAAERIGDAIGVHVTRHQIAYLAKIRGIKFSGHTGPRRVPGGRDARCAG